MAVGGCVRSSCASWFVLLGEWPTLLGGDSGADMPGSWCAVLVRSSTVCSLSLLVLRHARRLALRRAFELRRMSRLAWNVVVVDLEPFLLSEGGRCVLALWIPVLLCVSSSSRQAHNALRLGRERLLLLAM